MGANGCLVRWMIQRDYSKMFELNSASPHPRSKEALQKLLRERGHIPIAAEIASHVVGSMIYELRTTEYVIHTFDVHAGFRRQGVGTAMVDWLIKKLDYSRPRISTSIRESNLDAQLFLRAVGFRATNVFREGFSDPTEDEYFFVYRLPTQQPRFVPAMEVVA